MNNATLAPIADERILLNSAATLTAKFRDQYGEAIGRGAVTVSAVDANGTSVLSSTSATFDATNVQYTVSLAALSNLAFVTATWAASTASTETTVEVVSGYYFSIADARAYKNGVMADVATYPNTVVRATRDEVEREFERVIWPMVPRYRRVTVPATATYRLFLPDMHIRDVISIREYDQAGTLSYTWTAADLAGLYWDASGEVVSQSGKTFGWSTGTLAVEYSYGYERPSADVLEAAYKRLRHKMNADRSGVPDRAVSYVVSEGGSYSLSTPGRGGAITGIPDVDVVLNDPRYRRPLVGVG